MPDFVPTDRELEALKILWRKGPCPVSDICEELRKQGSDLAYTTVLSLLQVMEQKGLVGHQKGGKAQKAPSTGDGVHHAAHDGGGKQEEGLV